MGDTCSKTNENEIQNPQNQSNNSTKIKNNSVIIDGRHTLFKQKPFFTLKFKDSENEKEKEFYEEDFKLFYDKLVAESIQILIIFPYMKEEKLKFY